MIIGYARVSTEDQSIALQVDALRAIGAEKIFSDEGISGKYARRPGLDAALALAQRGDTIAVWKLDRLGRSLHNLIELSIGFRDSGIELRSITDGIDTTTPQGRFFFHIMGSAAEYEREMIVERVRAGIAAAKRRGTKLGRKPALTAADVESARMMLSANVPVAKIAKALKVSRPTVYRALE